MGTLVNAQDMKGRTPLHCAVAWLGFNSVLNGYLLDGANVLIHAGADIQIQAFDGRTAADCLPANLRRICVLMNDLSAKEDNIKVP
jgi:ankyrin repeat protein